jgi:two-component system LytT family sensor kinase
MSGRRDSAPRDELPLTRREVASIGAFWLAYAFLTLANRLFGMRGAFPRSRLSGGAVVVAIVEACCWALFTVVMLRLSARVATEHTPRLRQLLILSAIGLAAALVMTAVGHLLRESLFPPRRALGPGFGGTGPGGGGPPLWFSFVNSLVLYAGILAAGIARAYSYRYRAREQHAARLEAQLAGAQLDALRRQLDPHFLFNTLNLISSLVERDPRGVRRMIARLSELLRFSLEGASTPEITLRKELELLDRYLDIMRMRFEGRLDIVTHVDERALDTLVPSLVLQPLVENAVKHGVERLAGRGKIEIEVTIEGSTTVLRVRDNGPDKPRASFGTVATPGTDASAEHRGVGLANTAARLEQLYGPEERLTLRAAPGGGTEVTVRLPSGATPSAGVRGDAANAGGGRRGAR